MQTPNTLSEASKHLAEEGFQNEFEFNNNSFKLKGEDSSYHADQLEIVKHYRFEGDANPSDMSVIYAIETDDNKKGVFIDAYGTYASKEVAEFIKSIEKN